jgi:hypothetical protein
MNNLLSFYEKIKQFCDDYHMINEFLLLGSPDEVRSREFNYRSFIMIPSNSSMSRDLSRPIYTLSFDCTILDKCSSNSELSFVASTEENLFAVGQLQDFLIQEDEGCYIDEVEVGSFYNEDDNVTAAYFELTVSFARKNYNAGIDI